MIDIDYDEALGILRCVSQGQTPIAEVEQFAVKAVALQARVRARHGRCLILVDATQTVVHTQEATAHFSAMAASKVLSCDRTAIVLQAGIAKLQSQRMAPKEATAYFSNEQDALAWLSAEGILS